MCLNLPLKCAHFTLSPGEPTILERPLPVPVTWLSRDHQARTFVQGLIELNSNLKLDEVDFIVTLVSSRVLVDYIFLFFFFKNIKFTSRASLMNQACLSLVGNEIF